MDSHFAEIFPSIDGGISALQVLKYENQPTLVEFRNPRIFKWAHQGKMQSSSDTPLIADGMGECFPVVLRGRGTESALIHVEGGGVDGSTLRQLEDYLKRTKNVQALIVKADDTYPASQMVEQLLRRGVKMKNTIDIDVGKHHFGLVYRPKENKIYFDDQRKKRILVFAGF